MTYTRIILLVAAATAASSLRSPDAMRALVSHASDVLSDKMFNAMLESSEGQSLVESGYSVLVPLTQLQLGAARRHTRHQIAAATALPLHHAGDLAFVYRDLQTVEGVTLKLASRIFLSSEFQMNDTFMAATRHLFHTGAPVTVNVADSAATARLINHWVEERTNNRIKNLVDPASITKNTLIFLINAIYFKGTWARPFSKTGTYPAVFYLNAQHSVKIPTMYNVDKYYYDANDHLDAKVLQIPFKGNEAKMTFVVPNKVDGLAELVDKLLAAGSVRSASRNLVVQKVEVHLPKFKIETKTDLKQVLSKIGISSIFSTDAHLDYMVQTQPGRSMYIGGAVQKAFIEIDEEGAEAAAANSFQMFGMSALPEEPQLFRADRPFLFYLEARNVMLFSGVFTGQSLP